MYADQERHGSLNRTEAREKKRNHKADQSPTAAAPPPPAGERWPEKTASVSQARRQGTSATNKKVNVRSPLLKVPIIVGGESTIENEVCLKFSPDVERFYNRCWPR